MTRGRRGRQEVHQEKDEQKVYAKNLESCEGKFGGKQESMGVRSSYLAKLRQKPGRKIMTKKGSLSAG